MKTAKGKVKNHQLFTCRTPENKVCEECQELVWKTLEPLRCLDCDKKPTKCNSCDWFNVYDKLLTL